MGIITNFLGLRKSWRAFAEQNGYTFEDGNPFTSAKVIATYKSWTLTLDTYARDRYGTYTRLRVPYVNADGFRFSIKRSGVLSDLCESLGFHDIKIGDARFDDDFVIKANDEDKIKRLMSAPKLRALINQQPQFRLKVMDNNGWLGNDVPADVDILYFYVHGYIGDNDQLKSFFDLFTEILDGLCLMGSTQQRDPRVHLD